MKCAMMEKKSYKECFRCKFPDCKNNSCKHRYEPSIDPTDTKRLFNYFGEKITIKEAAKRMGVSDKFIRTRREKGWSDYQIALCKRGKYNANM
jgi:predicted DNA-binding protein (UPF0251 family)